jgi:hypothetical protein
LTRTRLEILQWFGLLGGAVAWTGQHVLGYFFADAGCNAAGAEWGLNHTPMQIALSVAAGAVVLAAEAAAYAVFRETRATDEYAPGPNGRLKFFAEAALLGNVLFFVIVVLDCISTVYHLPCYQS